MIYWLSPNPESPFPPPGQAAEEPNGLLAAGGDLHPNRLINAYRIGAFPWYGEGQPILWWSPTPRCVMPCDGFHISRRLRRELRNSPVAITTDRAFRRVVRYCAEIPRGDTHGTWIVPEMQTAYGQLHALGYAHSIEVWYGQQLVGGLYGVLLGQMFYAESMFTRGLSGSKIALLALCRVMHREGAKIIDCQLPSDHLMRLGARELAREDFISHVNQAIRQPISTGWPLLMPKARDLLE